ncbi:unnamed protein product [Diamesa serratosioi]
MYAVAGGQAVRRRQAQQVIKDRENEKKAKAKLDAQAKVPLTPTSKHFHQLPTSYLRAPHAHGRKLSAGYTTQSRSLLPISEQSAHHHSPSQQFLHHHHPQHPSHHQQQQHHNAQRTPTCHRELRLDVGRRNKKLTKSATATFPLVSHSHDDDDDGTPPETPTICFRQHPFNKQSSQNLLNPYQHHHQNLPIHIQIPSDNGIIITPATPLPSPSPSANNHQKQQNKQSTIPSTHHARTQQQQHHHHQQHDDVDDDYEPTDDIQPLERKCSVYRSRKLEANETTTINIADVDDDTNVQYQQQPQPFYTGGMPNGGHHTHWADDYCDDEDNRTVGICTCDHIECAQGRAAWLERGRRCSVQDGNQASFNRRWVKRNRVQDSSLGGSSDDEDFIGVIRGPSTFANAFLYIGLGTVSLGSIIFFVGTGEKGFKSNELRMIGPALVAIGLVFCILRIFFCVCPSHCISKRERNKKSAKVDADHRTSLLRDSTKRVSIARGPYINSKLPLSSSQSSQFPPKSIVKNKSYDGVEALRQTSLFLDNEHQINGKMVPIINEPDEGNEPPIELKKFDSLQVDTLNVIDIMSLTDEEADREIHQIDINQEIIIPKIEPQSLFSDVEDDEEEQLDSLGNKRQNKLNRQRKSLNQKKMKDCDTVLMETSLMIINPSSMESPPPPPPPFSPPPLTPTSPPPPLPLSPNIVTTYHKVPSTLTFTLPLSTSTATATTSPTRTRTEFSSSHQHDENHRHIHSHNHNHNHHKHRHSTAVTGESSTNHHSHHSHHSHQHHHQSHQQQPTESEIVLSPSKLGQ